MMPLSTSVLIANDLVLASRFAPVGFQYVDFFYHRK